MITSEVVTGVRRVPPTNAHLLKTTPQRRYRMAELHELTVAESAARIARRQLSPVELMESLLGARLGPGAEPEHLGHLSTPTRPWRPPGRARGSLDASGPRGPLHGVPVGVKDIYYTAGLKTTACSPILAEFVPDYDAASVALLKGAGAIVMGKTVTTQFACGDPPPTRNPWDAAHTPGGSSSGSAVGVAARTFPAALGSQTAGSVLRPASYNGVVGLKPTFGRISRYGVIPVAWSLDTMGSFTRSSGGRRTDAECPRGARPARPLVVDKAGPGLRLGAGRPPLASPDRAAAAVLPRCVRPGGAGPHR